MKILVVDDEARIRSIITRYLKTEGYDFAEAPDGLDAVELVQRNDYDLIVMDVMMPAMDGFEACRQIKKIKDVPVIMLSARGEEYDRIQGLELGADDYVTKPFSPRELMLRIKAVLHRGIPRETARDLFSLGCLKVDFTARKVTVDGQALALSPKEYELLSYLIKNKNIALSREQIIQRVWGLDYLGDDRTLDTHVKLLRKSLGEYAKHLVTVRGMGYRFESEN